jgi:hypothetical protein
MPGQLVSGVHQEDISAFEGLRPDEQDTEKTAKNPVEQVTS